MSVERLGSAGIFAILVGVTLSEEAKFQIRRGEQMLRQRADRRDRLREIARRVAAMLRSEFGAQRVWIFGSVVRPWFHEQSDLDIAVEGVAVERRGVAWDRALELANTEVDLVFIEEAPPLLRERILTDGEALM